MNNQALARKEARCAALQAKYGGHIVARDGAARERSNCSGGRIFVSDSALSTSQMSADFGASS
jgi:hypothetical protein